MAYRRRGNDSPPQVSLRSTEALEAAMIRADMSGADVGRRVGISRQYVNRMRAGEVDSIRYDLAALLERALSVSAGELFDYAPGVADAGALALDAGDIGAGLIATERHDRGAAS